MIYKEKDSPVMAEFGKGDINIVHVGGFNKAAVIFKNDIPKPIGTESSEWMGKSIEEVYPDIVMSFTRVESIDILISELEAAKKLLTVGNP